MAQEKAKTLLKKTVKKEEFEAEDSLTLANGKKEIKSAQEKAKTLKKTVKKEEVESEDSLPLANGKKEIKSTTIKKTKKTEKVIEKKKKKKQKKQQTPLSNGYATDDKKQKKAYDFPGQRHDPPEERDPLRIFYETLYEQVPDSEMAAFWLMERGLLPEEVAEKVYAKKLRGNQQKLSSPFKAVSVKKTSQLTQKSSPIKAVSVKKTSQVTQKSSSVKKDATKTSKKRKIEESDSDDDLILPKKIRKFNVS
ncbi:uncharacterized protein LOC18441768 [Amborella trichopoda]|uniref:Uncharacterized protein n=1 Tax=Amborella trichopoda TaxID=13333 RepID=W1PYT7_AMBTC|nr:uncharacterized protein LOC18441768 [Amborella trichopoda]ERN13523.1 hypothetical protein AMTR_s00041p00224610 [Amborella trichopoda]|eukprot:XP_006852056.1 uncharacterized protein LOC18441768 [Amborella trichopoda]